MRYKYIPVVISVALLSACYNPKYSATPAATNFERTEQNVVQAAHHWNLINNQVSKEFIASIASKVNKKERILIRPQDSVYSQQLYYDLIKSLTTAGYTVVKYDFKPNSQNRFEYQIEKNKPKHDISVDLKTDVLAFNGQRTSKQRYTGLLSTLAAGAWVLKLIPTNWGRGTALAAGVDAADYFYHDGDKKYEGDPPQTEIVIDILAARNDEYISVSKGIYYVVESDTSMYRAARKSIEPYIHEYSIVGAEK